MDDADEYASVEEDHWWFGGRRAVILRALGRFLAPGSSLLDVGCGTGALTAALGRRYRVQGVDASAEAVEAAVRRGVAARRVDPARPLPGGHDAVCAFDVLEHVDDDAGLARRLAAAVREGGHVALTVPAYRALWGPMDERAGHRRRYRRGGVVRLMSEAGVRRVHATYFNTLLFPAIAAARVAGFPRAGKELRPPPPPVNRLLRAVFTAEARLAARWELPVGASILYVGRRVSDG